LGYLIAHQGKHVRTEDILFDIFGSTSDVALNNFYQVVRRLRLVVEPNLISAMDSHLIRFDVKASTYQFVIRPKDSVDIYEFAAAIANMRRLKDEDAAREAQRAVALYQGDFLGTLKREDWADVFSEQFRDECIGAMRTLTKWFRRLRAWDQLAVYARRGIEMAPYDEEFCTAQLYHAAIDRNFKLFHETFKRHANATQEFLGAEPSTMLKTVYAKLKTQM